jgi:uncharacterized membrane protein (DUF4010 family)
MGDIDPRMLGLAVAVGLGLLVGLQREFAEKRIGLRSFALISTIGAIVGILAAQYGQWLLAAGLLAISAVIVGHAYVVTRATEAKGMTTELAAITMFLIGTLATSGHLAVAVVMGGVVTLLLHWKTPMHSWVERIGTVELGAIGRFVLITLVILPVLPDQTYGPYAVLNPRQIWLMVVLIVSLNLAGYVSVKILSGKRGALLSGVLGGLVSSTATTVGFSTKSRADPRVVPIAGVVILVASFLVYIRIIVETAVVAQELLPSLVVPFSVFMIVFLVAVCIQLFRLPQRQGEVGEPNNPAELKTALAFAVIYALVLFVSAAVNNQFGEAMLYPVAVVSGLTDVDAITLTIGRLYAESHIDGDTAWRVIFVASLSNLAFKGGVIAMLGGAQLRRRTLPTIAALLLLGVVGVLVWP